MLGGAGGGYVEIKKSERQGFNVTQWESGSGRYNWNWSKPELRKSTSFLPSRVGKQVAIRDK